MAVSPQYLNYILELLEPLENISSKNMFGGAGIYYRDRMFGLIAYEEFYLKTDKTTVAEFEEAGAEPFIFERKDGKNIAMSYYKLPEEYFDDQDEFLGWAQKAVSAALNAPAPKKRKKKKS